MTDSEYDKQLRILNALRKTLGAVVRDATPAHRGMQTVLSDATVADIKACFALIAARERELAQAAGVTRFAKPHYPDSPRTAQVVNFPPPADDPQGVR